MTPRNPLWNIMDEKSYQRGLEIEREMTLDDGDFDDDYETHMREECRQERFV